MGSIVKRSNPSGDTVYRALIRITRTGYPNYSESKTFSKRALAAAWLKKREAELEANPELLFEKGRQRKIMPTLKEASERYLQETQGTYAVNKASVIRLLGERSLGNVRLDRLKRSDFAAYALERQRGVPSLGMLPVKPSTINGDLQYLRSLLKYAHFV